MLIKEHEILESQKTIKIEKYANGVRADLLGAFPKGTELKLRTVLPRAYGFAAAVLRSRHGEHIVEHRRLKAGGVAVDEHEQRILRQHLFTGFDQAEQLVFQLPDLAAGASAVGGGIHDNSVISVAATNLALNKLCAIIHYPANRSVRKT